MSAARLALLRAAHARDLARRARMEERIERTLRAAAAEHDTDAPDLGELPCEPTVRMRGVA